MSPLEINATMNKGVPTLLFNLNSEWSSDNKTLVNVAPRCSKKDLFYKIVWFMSFYIQIILDMLADAFALHFKFKKIVGRDDHPLYLLWFILGYISWEKYMKGSISE